ncbi:hypothetical protein [Kordia sp.]|uniref:hypothetical protein n=1 Tax=Kordia sp. TaxID=1965332 RepID=UPI0025C1F9D5|nr:hypothetical protein [Kordia sp.]MCH2195969.1 hypothetical protein [Kordia sp.]
MIKLKKVVELKGVEKLTKENQKTINASIIGEGFGGPCVDSNDCAATNTIPSICCSGICVYTFNWRDVC